MTQIHRTALTLQLSATQTIAVHFQVNIDVVDEVPTYEFSGAFGLKTFSQTYTSTGEAYEAVINTFTPFKEFLRELRKSLSLDSPLKVSTKLYMLTFPNSGGDLQGSLQMEYDTAAPDQSMLLMTLDGSTPTITGATIQEVFRVLRPLGWQDDWLLEHARLDVKLSREHPALNFN